MKQIPLPATKFTPAKYAGPTAAEVLALRKRLNEAPRFEVQRSLMPYDELLPHAVRGRNERIDEPMS